MALNIEKLKAMTARDRHQLWLNAKAKAEESEVAKELVSLIEFSGLDYERDRSQPVLLDDPIGRLMKRIIGSDDGRRAMLDAVGRGLPALAGVDPLLQKELGPNYSKYNDATIQAGYLVNGFMEGLGYKKSHSAPMPVGCVAKTGLTFELRKQVS
jgi:hypothetical protein